MWNRRPENQDMYERKKFVFRGQNYNWLIGKTSNNILIFADRITTFSRFHDNIFNQKVKDYRSRLKYFKGAFSLDIVHYVNATLDES